MTFVADDGAKPSPRPTRTRETQRSRIPENAAGGAIKVPTDQKATPANKTAAPPTLHTFRGFLLQKGTEKRQPYTRSEDSHYRKEFKTLHLGGQGKFDQVLVCCLAHFRSVFLKAYSGKRDKRTCLCRHDMQKGMQQLEGTLVSRFALPFEGHERQHLVET